MAGSRVPYRIYRRTQLEHGNVVRTIASPTAGVITLVAEDEQHILVTDAPVGVSLKLPKPQKGMWFEIGNRGTTEAVAVVNHVDGALGSIAGGVTVKYLAVLSGGSLAWIEFARYSV